MNFKTILGAAAALAIASPALAEPANDHWVALGHNDGATGWIGDTPLPGLKPGDYPKAVVLLDPDSPAKWKGVAEILAIQDVDCARNRTRIAVMSVFSDRHQKHLLGTMPGDMEWEAGSEGSNYGEIIRITCAALEGA